MTDREVEACRAYLLKGGFVMFDDFRGLEWDNLRAQMREVLPDLQFIELTGKEAIFHAFFEINSLDNIPNYYDPGKPIFRGIYEGNDPKKRLMAIVNYNTDVSQFWEWSGRGLFPFANTNEAYKLGVNYLIYGMTH